MSIIYFPKKLLLTLLLPISLTFSNSSIASENNSFKLGLDASRSGEHSQALKYFKQAQQNGRDDGKLHYNLGVSYFKLAQYDNASTSFKNAAKTNSLAALSYYNLALISNARGEKNQTLNWLQRCLSNTQDKQLRGLANKLRLQLNSSNQTKAPPLISSAFLAINGGYDNNVLLRSDTLLTNASNQDDFFLDVFAYAERRSGKINYDVSAYLLNHADLSSYNLSFIRFGGSIDKTFNNWKLTPGLHGAFFNLGGNALYRTLVANINGSLRLKKQQRLTLAYKIEKIDEASTAYSYLSGWRHQFKAKSSWKFPEQKRLQVDYTLGLNDREDLTSGTTFTSYSPLRHTVRIKGTAPLKNNLLGSLSLRYRDSRYQDANILSDSSQITRQEQRYDISARVSRPLNKNIELASEYRYTLNQSNLSQYDYNRHTVSAGIAVDW